MILGHFNLVSVGKDDFEGENSPGLPRIDSGECINPYDQQ
jgi:hypothetical protein